MEQKQKFFINIREIGVVFYFFFILFLFFPLRYVFPGQFTFQTGAYSDFTSISLYLSDIFLIISAVFLLLPRAKAMFSRGNHILPRDTSTKILVFLVFCLFLTLFLKPTPPSPLNMFFFAKFLELLVAYGTSIVVFSQENIKKLILWFFILLSTFQALVSLSQFTHQEPVGLHKVGEQVIFPNILGVAKIVTGGITYVRGYGTFPHPNLLSAFLVTSSLLCLHFLKNSDTRLKKIVYSCVLFINLTGLTTTFSRAGFLAFITGAALWFSVNLVKKIQLKHTIWVLGVTVFSILTAFTLFKPYLLTRATFVDQSSLDRISYNKVGIQIIKDHPLTGVGLGESVLHMQQYSTAKLLPWDIQPIHNYFLLAAAEVGIIEPLILLMFFISHLTKLWKSPLTAYSLPLTAIVISFLTLMQFDHYFYTLQQTQMLLWISLGLIAAQTKTLSC